MDNLSGGLFEDIYITYFHHFFPIDNDKIADYKGVFNINGYNIAIFDMGSFGGNYYNADSLQQIPLTGFKRYPMKNTIYENYSVRNRELIYRGASLAVGDIEELKCQRGSDIP